MELKNYQCKLCEYNYDEKIGDEEEHFHPGMRFEDIPDDWTCPVCGAEKTSFFELK